MRFTAATYNILHGQLAEYRMHQLVQSITACCADIIGIQEVDVGTQRSGGRHLAKLMADELSFDYRFAKSIDYSGGAYGTAILSRYPISTFDVIPLTSGSYEQRSVGIADIIIDGEAISFLNTHLSFENKTQRTLQLEQIMDILPKNKPWILTGDFNTSDFSEIHALGDVSLVNDIGHIFGTFRENSDPIDNIVYPKLWSVSAAGMVENQNSDHNLLYAVFTK